MNGVPPSANMLRRRVTLQNRSTVNDGFGQETQTWTDVCTCFASVEPMAGSQQVSGSAEVSVVTHRVLIRYRSNITARMRVIYGSRIFEVTAAVDVEDRRTWLQLDCTEGLTAG